jgi:hypothetical protein
MNDTAKNANRIILKFITDKEAKLRYGAKLRAEMQEMLGRGEEPKGYRVEWILRTVNELFTWLGEKAAEFNAAHPQDAISVDDFSDVLATAQMRIRSRQRL